MTNPSEQPLESWGQGSGAGELAARLERPQNVSSRLQALLPRSLFGQFFTALISAVVLSTLLGVFINGLIARGLLYEIESEVGNAELRAVVDLITRTQAGIASFRQEAMDFRKEALRYLTELMVNDVRRLQREVEGGRISLEQAKRNVIDNESAIGDCSGKRIVGSRSEGRMTARGEQR